MRQVIGSTDEQDPARRSTAEERGMILSTTQEEPTSLLERGRFRLVSRSKGKARAEFVAHVLGEV